MVFVSDAVMRRRSAKKLFLKILQNSQENICVEVSFLIKLQASEHFLYRTPPVTASQFPRRFSKIFRCNLFTTSCKCCFVLRKISKLIQKISYFLQQNICMCFWNKASLLQSAKSSFTGDFVKFFETTFLENTCKVLLCCE